MVSLLVGSRISYVSIVTVNIFIVLCVMFTIRVYPDDQRSRAEHLKVAAIVRSFVFLDTSHLHNVVIALDTHQPVRQLYTARRLTTSFRPAHPLLHIADRATRLLLLLSRDETQRMYFSLLSALHGDCCVARSAFGNSN
jgi:hypothetical protein